MSTFKYVLAATTGLALLASAGAATAAPTVFTFAPSAAGLTGSNFTADKLNILDFARVDLTGSSGGQTTFNERGFLQVNNASLANNTFNPTGNRADYTLYVSFTGTGVQNASNFNQSSTGTFQTLSYTLFGVTGASTFGFDSNGIPTVANSAAPTAIATGTLTGGGTSLLVTGTNAGSNNPNGVSPGASVNANLVKIIPAFFVSPASMQFNLASAFNNDINIVTVQNNGTTFLLNGGGGDVTFSTAAIPEPASMALIGAGLAAVGLLRRRRA